jgi:hypothetical protein
MSKARYYLSELQDNYVKNGKIYLYRENYVEEILKR